MSGTTAVHVNDPGGFDVYIGRAVARRGLPESKWHNPFVVGRDGTRDEVIVLYEEYLLTRPDLLAALSELKGQRLGCWCAPQACHGDVLAKYAEAT